MSYVYKYKVSKALVVANTHILFNPKRGDIKLQQVKMTLCKLWEVSCGGAKSVIYCGDFNATPWSPLYDFISKGQLVLDHLCPSLVSGQLLWEAEMKARSAAVVRDLRGGRGG